MAKSLRSKSRRKNLREKRKRYGKKELASLMKILDESKKTDVVVRDCIEVVRNKNIVKKEKTVNEDGMEETEVSEVAQEKEEETLASLKALVKKDGTIPRWMHPRKARRTKGRNKVAKLAKKSRKKN